MEFGDIFSARSNASHGKHSRGKARKPRARKDCSSLLSCHEILFSASFSRVSRFNTGDKLLPGAKTRVHTYVCALFMCHSAQHIPIYLSTSVSRTHTRVYVMYIISYFAHHPTHVLLLDLRYFFLLALYPVLFTLIACACACSLPHSLALTRLVEMRPLVCTTTKCSGGTNGVLSSLFVDPSCTCHYAALKFPQFVHQWAN